MGIYIARVKGTTFCKIGYTSSLTPSGRLRGLQVGCPVEIEMIHWIANGSVRNEQYLHQQLKFHRCRGEWFDLPDDQVEKLKQIKQFTKDQIPSSHSNATGSLRIHRSSPQLSQGAALVWQHTKDMDTFDTKDICDYLEMTDSELRGFLRELEAAGFASFEEVSNE